MFSVWIEMLPFSCIILLYMIDYNFQSATINACSKGCDIVKLAGIIFFNVNGLSKL